MKLGEQPSLLAPAAILSSGYMTKIKIVCHLGECYYLLVFREIAIVLLLLVVGFFFPCHPLISLEEI